MTIKLFNFFTILTIFVGVFSFASLPAVALAEEGVEEKVNVYVFERENCNFCQLEKTFLNKQLSERGDFNIVSLDVTNENVKNQFDDITAKYNLVKATPVTLVGNSIIQGFNSDETTGKDILFAIDSHKGKPNLTIEEYLEEGKNLSTSSAICDDEGEAVTCSVDVKENTEIKVPFFGVIDFKEFSLFSMAVILGFVDGFNPCAMWVLLTFLLILWQVGNRKKMLQVAGLFILAEGIMYWAILNFWFSAWDFVGLDKFVTPAVGLLAVGGGIYFLRRYFKNKDQLICDVTDYESKSKTEMKIKNLISSPMTILTALGIMGVAFSVNIIEFACSVGIPQTFTKVLEMNNLNLLQDQFYILVYTLFYMVDDFVVFGLALYGFDKFYTVGTKYSNLSSLIGGVLMLILGGMLLFAPNLLVF
ncbi:TPA: glutaredoxin [Candidatus Campbellbacteria bacterium]|nr:MAG: glutaredoxin [Candidatus Campbellbacteria bacterium GW2011_OD1_34_28]KKP75230.1 MAG: Glutaredoxin domain protein [Candidatus Campbellbacteria bacterium GW2011_GWD2_35_24]KKP76209.1 MAG: glutaredoxin [Candidatus Campbellbacteria bacterium GW2011_GWC2_35_28]KKP77398.1 MAG: Glutaredoxin domain protein [Candidatus Campbellbacteria bacterium GW2011_GWC1_35_31]KKP79327.1 MAG: Glutaredoxin domain protein [Candidatus Campbellbacteria bacterium GW2011_GWD1_35_49]HAP73940.1 glutaredoxin [Candida